MSESLTNFVEDICKESHRRVENDYGDGFVRLRSDEAQRRQAAHDIRCTEDILIEVLRNSRDAHARTIFVALSKQENNRTITIIDDGDGIPEHMHSLVFEPRVTSKLETFHMDKWGVHGRGMALYSITMNTSSAAICRSYPKAGCAIRIEADLQKLTERKDQSSFPVFKIKDNNTVSITGPKNLLRTLCEFALEHKDTLSVFVGSPAEIASCLYQYGLATVSSFERSFTSDYNSISNLKLLSFAQDPKHFQELAYQLGLRFSERTARRIMDGEIEQATNILDLIQSLLTQDSVADNSKQKKRIKPTQTNKIFLDVESKSEFANSIKEAYLKLADAYYLDPGVEPEIRIQQEQLTVSIPLIRQ